MRESEARAEYGAHSQDFRLLSKIEKSGTQVA